MFNCLRSSILTYLYSLFYMSVIRSLKYKYAVRLEIKNHFLHYSVFKLSLSTLFFQTFLKGLWGDKPNMVVFVLVQLKRTISKESLTKVNILTNYYKSLPYYSPVLVLLKYCMFDILYLLFTIGIAKAYKKINFCWQSLSQVKKYYILQSCVLQMFFPCPYEKTQNIVAVSKFMLISFNFIYCYVS